MNNDDRIKKGQLKRLQRRRQQQDRARHWFGAMRRIVNNTIDQPPKQLEEQPNRGSRLETKGPTIEIVDGGETYGNTTTGSI